MHKKVHKSWLNFLRLINIIIKALAEKIVDDDEDVAKYAFKTSLGRFVSANDKGKVVQAIQLNESEWFWKILPGTDLNDEPVPPKKEEEEVVEQVDED